MVKFKDFFEDKKQRIIKHDPDKQMITLCSYCDKDEQEKNKWSAMGYEEISHGVCDGCMNEQLANLKDL